MSPDLGRSDPRAERETKEAKAIMVLVIAATMLFGVADSLEWYTPVGSLDHFELMAHALFTEFIVPFEVLGFLLLAALIGALYLASREASRRV